MVGEALPLSYLAVIAVVLSVIDIREHRLPNKILLPSYAVAAILFIPMGLDDPQGYLRSMLSAAVLFGAFLVLAIIGNGALGMGDVKLAGLLGMYLGWFGWTAVFLGGVLAFILGGIWALALLVARIFKKGTSELPFGPSMFLGAFLAMFVFSV